MPVITLSNRPIPLLLMALRFLACLAASITLLLLIWLDYQIPSWLWLLPVSMLLANLFWWRRFRQTTDISERELFCHLLFDCAMLLIFLWPLGGASNPFVSFFLVPVALASILLPKRFAFILGVTCTLAYSLLLWHFLDGSHRTETLAGFHWHIIGMWFNFVLAAAFLWFCLTTMLKQLQRRDQQLNEQRERLLRDDAILGMASLAAGTAHALNTPLGTITLAAEALGNEPALSAEAYRDIDIIGTQAALCGSQLKRIASLAHPIDAPSQPLVHYLATLIAQWQTRRPKIQLLVTHPNPPLEKDIREDQALEQALTNLFDNAADASLQAGDHTVAVSWWVNSTLAGECLEIELKDNGKNSNINALNSKLSVTTKTGGLGLGLILARANIYRLGGQLHFFRLTQGGTSTRICIPLDALTASPQITSVK